MYKTDEITANCELTPQTLKKPEVFSRLYRQYYDAVFRYCVHRLFDRNIAEDVTSEVFFNCLRNFGSFRGDEKQFRNWLYKIATNSINNHLRKAARKKTLIEAISQTANNQVVDCSSSKQQSEENFALLRKAMFELKPRYQTIITLRFFENLKLTEIAEVLSSRPGTVRSQLARALAKLRKKLDSIWCED